MRSRILPLALLAGMVCTAAPSAVSRAADKVDQSSATGTTFRDCTVCPEMVVVPAGTFTMGSAKRPDEQPRHEVTFSEPFAIGVYEITFEEWDACVADGGCGGYRPKDNGWGRGRRPVVNVSRHDADAYAKWLSAKTGQTYRLPSEAAWEYAAAAGTTTPAWTGAVITAAQANFNGQKPAVRPTLQPKGVYRKQTLPVGTFEPNPFGLHDVLGNVWEWVADCYHKTYDGAPTDGSVWRSNGCKEGVIRGGAWLTWQRYMRSANRHGTAQWPRKRNAALGFRIARSLHAD